MILIIMTCYKIYLTIVTSITWNKNDKHSTSATEYTASMISLQYMSLNTAIGCTKYKYKVHQCTQRIHIKSAKTVLALVSMWLFLISRSPFTLCEDHASISNPTPVLNYPFVY